MRRREFLSSTALTATGLAVPWHHVASAGMRGAGEGDDLKLGLIGVGYQGRELLNSARQVKHVRFQAICDIWEYARNFGQKYLARYGQEVTPYTDYRKMLDEESDLDAVLIATPDFVHAPQAIACLEKGLHVYCEPMLAHTLDAARSIVQAVGRTGKLLQVGFQRRSNPRYQHTLRLLLQEAQLPGTLTAVQTQWAQEADDLRGWARRYTIPDEQLRPFGYHDMSQFRNWMWYRTHCGGPFCSYVTQQLDVCHWYLGTRPKAVIASGGNDYYSDRHHFDTMMSVFEFPNAGAADDLKTLRASCNMLTTTSAGGMRQYERFLGTEGSVQISQNPRWTRVGREPSAGDWDQWVRKDYLVKPELPAAHDADEDAIEVHVSGELELFQLPDLQTDANCAPHLANFCDAIRGDAELACPVDKAWTSHVAAFKAIEAATQRKTVSLSPEDYAV